MRPLVAAQPWGIFFVEFEKKKLPILILRRILSHLVLKKRASANKSDAQRWQPNDLLFISAFGEESSEQREIASDKPAPRESAAQRFRIRSLTERIVTAKCSR